MSKGKQSSECSAIEKAATEAALDRCRALADSIKSELRPWPHPCPVWFARRSGLPRLADSPELT